MIGFDSPTGFAGTPLDSKQQRIQLGAARATAKFNYFYPDARTPSFTQEDLGSIVSVIDSNSEGEEFNVRFWEIYVETVAFCQMVRRHNDHELLNTDELDNIISWLSKAVNSLVHL